MLLLAKSPKLKINFSEPATAYDAGHFNVAYDHTTSLLSLPHMIFSAELNEVVSRAIFFFLESLLCVCITACVASNLICLACSFHVT